MKLCYTNTTGKITVEAEAATTKEAFERFAELAEICDEQCCGACDSINIRFDLRRADNFKFYNLVCRDCGARLDFGQLQTGDALFAKRRHDDGTPKPHNGWYRYQPEGGNGHTPPAAQSTHPPVPATKAPVAGDLYHAAISTAKSRKELDQVGQLIAADGSIAASRRDALRKMYETRQTELNGKAR